MAIWRPHRTQYILSFVPFPFIANSTPLPVMTGIVGIFIPFGQTMDLIYAIGGTLIFSGYIVYDTYNINKRLSPDEFIMGAISLYLECVAILSSLAFGMVLTAGDLV